MLIIDSREKPKAVKRILAYFDAHHIDYEVSKLLFGDYMEYSRPGLVIDRKQNIAELAKNCTSEHERFRRELERVKRTGSEMVILVEQNSFTDRGEKKRIRTIEDLMTWSSPHTIVKGEKVYRVLRSWMAKYPIGVEFCDKRSTGKRIIEILYGDKHGR